MIDWCRFSSTSEFSLMWSRDHVSCHACCDKTPRFFWFHHRVDPIRWPYTKSNEYWKLRLNLSISYPFKLTWFCTLAFSRCMFLVSYHDLSWIFFLFFLYKLDIDKTLISLWSFVDFNSHDAFFYLFWKFHFIVPAFCEISTIVY